MTIAVMMPQQPTYATHGEEQSYAELPLSPASPLPAGGRCCPNCGWQDVSAATNEAHEHADSDDAADPHAALAEARRQIADLQAQVRLLNQKAAAAIDRWADYEDELSRLRAANASATAAAAAAAAATDGGGPSPTSNAGGNPSPTRSNTNRTSFLPAGAGARLSALLAPRKSTPNLRSPPATAGLSGAPSAPVPPPLSPLAAGGAHGGQQAAVPAPLASPAPTTDSLLEALEREQALRRAAEGRLSATSREVEELSVSLFEQANEMVATERRARASLEQRVEVLERRDQDKKRRLDRLELAVGRIERVRDILQETGGIPEPLARAAGRVGPPRSPREVGGVMSAVAEKGKVAEIAAVSA